MCKFESSQKDESRWQSTDSSKAYRNTSAFKCNLSVSYFQQTFPKTSQQKSLTTTEVISKGFSSKKLLTLTASPHLRQSGVHLAWKKGVCRGRAAFDITFQHYVTFSLKTGNRPMNFAICPSLIN